jgi:hypothetical protein
MDFSEKVTKCRAVSCIVALELDDVLDKKLVVALFWVPVVHLLVA